MAITSPGLVETNIISSDNKLIEWLFTVTDSSDNRYYWSFSDIPYTESTGDVLQEESGTQLASGDQNDFGGDNQDGTNAFYNKILSFNGITLRRPSSENAIIAPSNITFVVSNKDSSLTASNFTGGVVWIHLSISDGTNSWRVRKNRFKVKTCEPGYQKMTFKCEDYLQDFLRGDYPNTRLIKDIFPGSDTDIDDQVCVPEPYGVAYVPLRSDYLGSTLSVGPLDTISFVAATSGAHAQINDSLNTFGIFGANRFITISGANDSENNGTFFAFTVAAGRIELAVASGVSSQIAGSGDDEAGTITITQGARYYILGDTTNTYNIHKVRSPREWGRKSEWADLNWTLSLGAGTAEYYAVNQSSGNPNLSKPVDAYGIPTLTMNRVVLQWGDGSASGPLPTIGALTAGQWSYGKNAADSLSFDTIYVRTSGDADPDGLSDNYISSDFTFTQSTKADGDSVNWRVFQPIIADVNTDDVADANGLWRQGDYFMDMPTKFSRSDTINKTDPGDVIKQVLLNIGVPADDIDNATFDTASTTFAAYTVPLVFNGAYWFKQPRIKALNALLNMCNAILISEEKIQIKILVKASQKEFHRGLNIGGSSATYEWIASGSGTNEYYCRLIAGSADPSLPEPSSIMISEKSATRGYRGELNVDEWDYADNDSLGYSTVYVRLTGGTDPDGKDSHFIYMPADILKPKDQGEGTFRYRDITEKFLDDAGYCTFQPAGEAQDKFMKILVPIGGSVTKISGDIVELPFLQDSRDAQQASKLYYQRKLGKVADASFQTKATCLLLQPGDVVTINDDDYGGNYEVLVNSVSINKDGSVNFTCGRYSQAFADWDDAVPSAITISTDDTVEMWEPSVGGPTTKNELARGAFRFWGQPWLTVAPVENQGQYTSIQAALNALEQSNHDGIFLMNGTYVLDAPIYLPDRDITVIGESQGGVIIQNNAGDDCFILHNLTKSFSFDSFTFDSQVSEDGHDKFFIYGDTHPEFTGDVTIRNIVFNLDSSTYSDYGITINDVSGSRIIVADCIFNDGFKAITAYADVYSSLFIQNNTIDNFDKGMHINARTALTITNNVLTNIQKAGSAVGDGPMGFWLPGSTGTLTITGNYIEGKLRWGMWATAASANGTISNNTIISTYDGTSAIIGIILTGSNHTLSQNSIDITTTSVTASIYGLWLSGLLDSTVVGNSINASDTNTTANHYGIHSTGDRNSISNNNINLVNNDAKDIGINFAAGSDNNVGTNNLTYRVGSSVVDGGAGNNVTAQDV